MLTLFYKSTTMNSNWIKQTYLIIWDAKNNLVEAGRSYSKYSTSVSKKSENGLTKNDEIDK